MIKTTPMFLKMISMAENTVLSINLILKVKCKICKKQGINMNNSNQNRLDFITSLHTDLYFIDLQSLQIDESNTKKTDRETRITSDSAIQLQILSLNTQDYLPCKVNY